MPDLTIHIFELDRECSEQAERSRLAGTASVLATAGYRRLKLQLERLEKKFGAAVRSDPGKFGLKKDVKVTIDAVAEIVASRTEVRTLQDDLLDAENKMDEAGVLYAAEKERGRQLSNEVQLVLSGYCGDPQKVRRAVGEARLGEMRRDKKKRAPL